MDLMGVRKLAQVVGCLVVLAMVVAATDHGAAAAADPMKALGFVEAQPSAPAPEITLSTTGGATLAMKDLRGKAVLVNFWATWCKPCQWELPLMETLYQAYKDRGFIVLGISLDQLDAEAVSAFVKEKKLTFPVALDQRGEVAREFGIRGLPATVLIGPDGHVRGVTYGPKEWAGTEARALIASLLPASRPAETR